ncbi:MAG: hydrogenase expression/formation protein HypE [Anaerolineae bacterium]|nr:hydrogenase expression/formation protein HypE [Anaerolineae bacterium]
MSDTTLNLDGWTCPIPLRDYPNVILGHGGGGKLSAELVQNIFLPAFHNDVLGALGDSAVLYAHGERIAFSTDSFVVQPLFFPGGCIGDLAINGTVNDLAMSGAKPLFLSAGFIVEEGMPINLLAQIAERMGAAARRAGVRVVTGDTKVVEKGHGDGVFINTSGLGFIPEGVHIAPDQAKPGDVVLVSGTIGDHGMAVMSAREGLAFDTTIESDCAPLGDLVAAMLAVTPDIHVLRDPTRGGVASSLNEIAGSAGVGIVIEENRLPVKPAVQSACEMLGMDPLYVANEGKLLAIVPPSRVEAVLDAMRAHPLGHDAAIIGRIVEEHPGLLAAKTALGATRIVDMQVGEQLPRIC